FSYPFPESQMSNPVEWRFTLIDNHQPGSGFQSYLGYVSGRSDHKA
ncbi:unnamed protein product, partial [marine sediment metagenome]